MRVNKEEAKATKKRYDYLMSIGCKDVGDVIITENGDSVVYKEFLSFNHEVTIICEHKLSKLESIEHALNKGTCVVQLGFSEKEQKWYGWAGRGFGSFGIGYKVPEGSPICSSSYGLEAGFECKTLEDCKRCAIAMADGLD